MSQDTYLNAFSAFRAESSGKSSTSEVLVDFRPQHFLRVFGFSGSTTRDVESTFEWNSCFRSPDETEQTALVQEASKAQIVFTGTQVLKKDIERERSSIALQLESLREKQKSIVSDLAEVVEAIELAPKGLLLKQKEESLKSKLQDSESQVSRLETHLGYIRRWLDASKRADVKVHMPVLKAGVSRVIVKYYRRQPIASQHIDYLRLCYSRIKSWELLTTLAPSSALSDKKNAKGVPIPHPMPKQAANAIIAEQKKKGEDAPHASNSRWSPEARAAYAWLQLIMSYNTSWGALAPFLVPIPPKVKLDGRFVKRIRKQNPPAKTGEVVRMDQVQGLVEQSLKKLLAAMVPQENLAPASPKPENDLNPLKTEMEKARDNAYARIKNRIQTVVSGETGKIRDEFQVSYVVNTITGWIRDFDYSDPFEFLSDWASTLFDDREILKREQHEITFDHVMREDYFLEVFSNADLRRGAAALRQEQSEEEALNKHLMELEDAREAVLRQEERDRFLAAEEISHSRCGLHENKADRVDGYLYCSEMCPKIDIDFDQRVSDSESGEPSGLQTDDFGYEDVPPQTVADLSPEQMMELGVEPSAPVDPPSEPATSILRNGLWFHRWDLVIVDGAALTAHNFHDALRMIAPKDSAFLSVFQGGTFYVHLGNVVSLPKGDAKVPVSGLKPTPKPRDEADVDRLLSLFDDEVKIQTKSDMNLVTVPAFNLAGGEGVSAKPPVPPKGPEHAVSVKGKGKQKANQSPEPSGSSPISGKVKGKPKKERESAPVLDWEISIPHKITGSSVSDPSSTLDGQKKAEWIVDHTGNVIPKSEDTQQAACVCVAYPCRHTKSNVSAKIRQAKDLAWNLAYQAAGGKLSTDANSKASFSSPKSPEEEKNPLRVKNLPRTEQLTHEDREQLRKFFGLKEQLSEEEWSALSKEERNKFRSENAIPRWATAVVLRDHDNLKRILDKKLNKVRATELLKQPAAKDNGSCSLEWTRLKSRFEGVPLLSKPRSGQQKALKKAYDALQRKYPGNPCLPKPKQGGGKDTGKTKGGGKPSPPAGKTAGSSSGDDFSKLVKVMMLKMMSDM